MRTWSLTQGPDPHGLDFGGIAGIDGDTLGVSPDPDGSVNLEPSLAPGAGKLFGQLVVQPDHGAIGGDDVFEAFQLL